MTHTIVEPGAQARASRSADTAGSHAPEFTFRSWKQLPGLDPVRRAPDLTAEHEVPPIERVVALLAVTALVPVLLLVAAAIKFCSPGGPVLYRQLRVGVDRRRQTLPRQEVDALPDRRKSPGFGRTFWIYKFRTMIPDAEKHTGPTWASKCDPRIFPLGRLLRLTRLDELPQLFNVVVGDMRLIGPRPERPHFVEQLTERIPEYARRQRVPPGITGLAQVEREYDASVDDVRTKVKYDLFYVDNRSRRLDAKIAIKTIDVVLRGKGAR